MTTFERIQELAKKRDKNLKEVSLELGYSKNYLYTLRTKEPAADKLRALADYFNVSIDYLLGRTENPNVVEEDDSQNFAQFFKMETKGMSDEEIEVLEKEWKQYLVIRKQMLNEDK